MKPKEALEKARKLAQEGKLRLASDAQCAALEPYTSEVGEAIRVARKAKRRPWFSDLSSISDCLHWPMDENRAENAKFLADVALLLGLDQIGERESILSLAERVKAIR